MDNLVTACVDCNLGKGARSLTAIPQALAEKAADVAEREEQLRGYQQILEARRRRLEEETLDILVFIYPPSYAIPNDEFLSTRKFIEKLGFDEVREAAEVAMAAPVHYRSRFRYFCGVCWRKIRELSK